MDKKGVIRNSKKIHSVVWIFNDILGIGKYKGEKEYKDGDIWIVFGGDE